MIGRRSFFRGLFGGAAVAAPAIVAAATPEPTGALDLVQPYCPKCCCVQWIPTRNEFKTQAAWLAAVTTPTTITCINDDCKHEMTVTFARRT